MQAFFFSRFLNSDWKEWLRVTRLFLTWEEVLLCHLSIPVIWWPVLFSPLLNLLNLLSAGNDDFYNPRIWPGGEEGRLDQHIHQDTLWLFLLPSEWFSWHLASFWQFLTGIWTCHAFDLNRVTKMPLVNFMGF